MFPASSGSKKGFLSVIFCRDFLIFLFINYFPNLFLFFHLFSISFSSLFSSFFYFFSNPFFILFPFSRLHTVPEMYFNQLQ
ncbi:hypothetical protein EO98_16055 [Methanosarcina sp. 2.H.T.1A.6]|nr:hypothetical protein EO97_11555 [Methanosarcina sp. 2.H.T.1A.15]KKG17668.1 hypothetical protein EO94_12480 [Methanosarcina sp. 2.H.T.1A.3]KKG21908.1 hypothetical protein EO98_16055 [Methanosarcina sp. 2.H.T.1A.6]KKG25444.1 hypothetical protein EO96_00505 [Methanosarcina sp. 2.H.T.1A.8]